MGLPPLPNAEEEDEMEDEEADDNDEEGGPALQDVYYDDEEDDDEEDDDDEELGCKLGALQKPGHAEDSKADVCIPSISCQVVRLADEPKLAEAEPKPCAAPEAPPKPAKSTLQSLATPMNKRWTTTAELKSDRVERLARIALLKNLSSIYTRILE